MDFYECENKSRIYATALLSDGEILFWKIGQSPKSVHDFYKDFYYSGINQTKYFETHVMEVKVMCFEFIDEEDSDINNFTFRVLAKKFFERWDVSKDSKGDNPY